MSQRHSHLSSKSFKETEHNFKNKDFSGPGPEQVEKFSTGCREFQDEIFSLEKLYIGDMSKLDKFHKRSLVAHSCGFLGSDKAVNDLGINYQKQISTIVEKIDYCASTLSYAPEENVGYGVTYMPCYIYEKRKVSVVPIFKVYTGDKVMSYITKEGTIYSTLEDFFDKQSFLNCLLCTPKEGEYKEDKILGKIPLEFFNLNSKHFEKKGIENRSIFISIWTEVVGFCKKVIATLGHPVEWVWEINKYMCKYVFGDSFTGLLSAICLGQLGPLISIISNGIRMCLVREGKDVGVGVLSIRTAKSFAGECLDNYSGGILLKIFKICWSVLDFWIPIAGIVARAIYVIWKIISAVYVHIQESKIPTMKLYNNEKLREIAKSASGDFSLRTFRNKRGTENSKEGNLTQICSSEEFHVEYEFAKNINDAVHEIISKLNANAKLEKLSENSFKIKIDNGNFITLDKLESCVIICRRNERKEVPANAALPALSGTVEPY